MPSAVNREIELKLRVPSTLARSIDLEVTGRGGSSRTHLLATYADTPNGDLAAAHIAWRLRKEGRRWVQTLKALSTADATGLVRSEHEVARNGAAMPALDRTLHDGTPAGEQLKALIDKVGVEPTERFRTDIWRRARKVRTKLGTVELAFDRGKVVAGERSSHVCELEIELVSGSVAAVMQSARGWITEYGLWLDSINKSMRGTMLADGATELPLVKAAIPHLTADMSADAMVRQMVRTILPQVLHNASAVAEDLGGHEHIHQARIGIRRIRTVLGAFADHVPAIDPNWSMRLAHTFSRLGELRDREVVLAQWNDLLTLNGAPPFPVPVSHDTDPRAVLRERDFSLLLVDLLEYAHGEPDDTTAPAGEVVPVVLQHLHRQVKRRSKRFATANVEYRHATRKAVKRLRYIAELSASLYPPKKVKAFLGRLAPAQERLGELNDLLVATDIYRDLTHRHGQAWFAVGWLSSLEKAAVKRSVKPLARVAEADPFWR